MRLKHSFETDRQFKCCLCCHVRLGTILLGLWNLIGQLFVITVLVMSLVHPELLKDGMEPGTSMESDGILVVNSATKSEAGEEFLELKYATPNSTLITGKLKKSDMCLLFLLVLCPLLVTIMMLYGTIKSRPGYLTPFFFLQVFDFGVTCLTAIGFLSYKPDVKIWIMKQNWGQCALKDRLLTMDEEWLMLLVVIGLILLISAKAYLISMVWACYKYLQMRNASRTVLREYTVDPDSEMLLPPKYEEAINMSSTPIPAGPPPPPYTQ